MSSIRKEVAHSLLENNAFKLLMLTLACIVIVGIVVLASAISYSEAIIDVQEKEVVVRNFSMAGPNTVVTVETSDNKLVAFPLSYCPQIDKSYLNRTLSIKEIEFQYSYIFSEGVSRRIEGLSQVLCKY